jgi:glutathione S-transferase
MPELQTIGAPQSNYVWATRIACIKKGVPYTLLPALPHTAEVDAIHPFGKIPVMRHGDVTLCESRAISYYVDHVFEGPGLMPRDPVVGARVEQWISLVNTQIDPSLFRPYVGAYFFPGTPDGSPNRTAIEGMLPKMEPQFAVLERAIAKTGHLVGSLFTLADANLLPILFYLDNLPESGATLRQMPKLKGYLEQHLARPSVKETTPPPFPGRTSWRVEG